MLVACDSPSPQQRATTSPSEPAAPTQTPAVAEPATLRATPDTDLRVGQNVDVCWEAPGRSDCTLSILHASGEGDFGDVAASACRPVIVERTTLIELFCDTTTHALLQLNATE